MAKLLILRGLPASGKSTRAKEVVAMGNWVRVNRDLLRTMLHFDKFTGINEGLTVDAEKAIVRKLLTAGQNVVVDDVNLNPKNHQMWGALSAEIGATYAIETIKTPMEECIRRDSLREKKVGRDVIVQTALQYGYYPIQEIGRDFVLCDLDGTLCDITHRLNHVNGLEKDWGHFFAGIPGDTIRPETIKILNDARARGCKIFFVSARPDDYKDLTVEWLVKHLPIDFEYAGLIMRRAGDRRDDVIVKQEMYDKYFKDKHRVEFVIDDRPKVIEMWRSNGLHVIDVGDGKDF